MCLLCTRLSYLLNAQKAFLLTDRARTADLQHMLLPQVENQNIESETRRFRISKSTATSTKKSTSPKPTYVSCCMLSTAIHSLNVFETLCTMRCRATKSQVEG